MALDKIHRLIFARWNTGFNLSLVFCLATLVNVSNAETIATDDAVCVDCHNESRFDLTGGPHRLGQSFQVGQGRIVGCVSCHSGAESHVQEPSRESIQNPAMAGNQNVTVICSQCHVSHLERDAAPSDPHLMAGLNCTSCHTIHAGDNELLPDDITSLCDRCHPAILTQFRRPSAHPLAEDAITCLSCHSMTGRNEPQFGHGGSANCYDCHPEQGGPFRFEHSATNSFSPDGHGCIACHSPHGSPNDRLLSQPGVGLCNQCHGTPPRHRTAHFSGLGIQYQCIECHSEIHGSDYNRKLLDPELDQKIPGGNCFNPGCHAIN